MIEHRVLSFQERKKVNMFSGSYDEKHCRSQSQANLSKLLATGLGNLDKQRPKMKKVSKKDSSSRMGTISSTIRPRSSLHLLVGRSLIPDESRQTLGSSWTWHSSPASLGTQSPRPQLLDNEEGQGPGLSLPHQVCLARSIPAEACVGGAPWSGGRD